MASSMSLLANSNDKRVGIVNDFWEVHGFLFVLGLMFLPRITVIFFSVVTGGPFFWLGFILFPRVVIIILAGQYWDTNPVFVFFAALWCYVGESLEKSILAEES
tara:strand:+ start:10202 stop:10513 length:312 start_codon:yes stop_codon:yes gene_type:complete